MADASGIIRSFYPFYAPLGPTDVTTAPPFSRTEVVKQLENIFFLSLEVNGWARLYQGVRGGKYLASFQGMGAKENCSKEVPWRTCSFPYPRFGLKLPEGVKPGLFAEEVERQDIDIIGPCHENELSSAWKIVEHQLRVNRVFEELGIEVVPWTKLRKVSKWMHKPDMTGSIEIGQAVGGKKQN